MLKFLNFFQNKENLYKDIFKLKNKKILINSHSNLVNNAGDVIMISNYMNLLMKNNNFIFLLSVCEINQNFTKNLLYTNYKIIKSEDNKELIKQIDYFSNKVDYIFIRNHLIIDQINNKKYLSKTILYGLDIHLPLIKRLNNYLEIITQSKDLKNLYIKNGIDKKKIRIIEPFAYKYNFKSIKKNNNLTTLIYCGTIRKEENIIQLIDEFKEIHKKKPKIFLKIVYGKIHGDINFKQKIESLIERNIDGITFKHNLSHKDACYEIASSDYGIFMRADIKSVTCGLAQNGQVSTKFKEYKLYKIKILNNFIKFK